MAQTAQGVSLLGLLVVLLVVVGVVLGLVAIFSLLLSNRKTRTAGVVVLAGGGVVTLTLFALLLWATRVREVASFQQAVAQREIEADRVRAEQPTGQEVGEGTLPVDALFEEATQPAIDLSDDPDGPGAEPAAAQRVTKPERKRPAWLDEGPAKKPGVATAVMYAGPHVTRRACEQDLDRQLIEWLNTVLGNPTVRLIRPPADPEPTAATAQDFGLSSQELRDLIVRDRYYETIDSSVASGMQRLAVLLELNESDAARLTATLEARAAAARRSAGLGRVGAIAGGVLGLLALALGALKLDAKRRQHAA